MKRLHYRIIFALVLGLTAASGKADYSFNVGGALNLGAGAGNFAPFYLHANNYGKITQSKNVQLDVWAIDSLDLNKRFDFSWGVEAIGGWANKVNYRRYHTDPQNPTLGIPYNNPQAPPAIWIQQLFAEVKWRSLFLSAGIKDRQSSFVDQELSSGDLLWSGNSRAIPEVRIGFVDFQNIPLTKKWVQIDAVISYGKFIDTKWINNHFDFWTGNRNPGSFWTYKRLYLRSNPDKPFMGQFGFQMSGIFGGRTFKYDHGKLVEEVNNYGGFKDFFLMLIPLNSNTHEGYKTGDHKGSWDIALRYRFKRGETLRAYTQWFWEDGSSLLKQNRADGLWGLEFKMNRKWWISGAVFEYLDLTNMCGPISYSPGYNNANGATLNHTIYGRDGYYNNHYYRSYVNYGLNMGTPMVMGVLFNTGENSLLKNNGKMPYFRVRGFHFALQGSICGQVDYIIKYNHRKAWGDTNSYALINPAESDSFMIGASYCLPQVTGLTLNAAFGLDRGNLPANATGFLIGAVYEMPVNIKSHGKNENK